MNQVASHPANQRLGAEVQYWATVAITMLVYSAVLFFSYRDLISPRYAYLSFRTPDPLHYWLTFLLTVVTALVLPHRIRRAGDMAQWLLFLTAQAPMMLLGQYMGWLTPQQGLVLAGQIAVCTLLIRVLVGVAPDLPKGSLPKVTDGGRTVFLLLGILAAALYGIMIATVGISTTWLSFDEVYGAREDFVASVASVPVLGYLIPVLSNAINPIFIARGIYSMRWRWIVAGGGGQVLIYMTTTQKFVLFSTVAFAGIAILFRSSPRLRGTRLFWAVSGACLGALAVDTALNTHFWTDMFTRRFVVIPAALSDIYAAIFMRGNRPYGHFTDTPLIGPAFGTDPYPRGVSYAVGEVLTGNPYTDANVSVFGNGYYQLGFTGMLISCALLSCVLIAFNWSTRGLPIAVSSILVFLPTMALAATGVFTAITSHGTLAIILICACLPRTGWGRRPANSGSNRGARGTTSPRIGAVR